MKRIIAYFTFAALLLSCTQMEEYDDRLTDLETRVKALETQINSLNDNIAALQTLAGGGTINSVVEENGVYTITTSNGGKIILNQGSVGVGKAPIMSIDKDGYWMVDYQDGKGPQYVLSNGNKVLALGEDGIAPEFGVDKDGYWTVSYDKGQTFENVLDSDGNKVKAISDGISTDSYFADVKLENSVLTLVLKNGDIYTVPVISDFLCSIEGSDMVAEFEYGTTKAFVVEMKGVSQYILSVPQGWEANLTENLLKVTSPNAPTKAVVADSRTDVSIIAMSDSGYGTIAKLQVKLSGVSSVLEPVASVSFVSSTINTMTFKVILEDVTKWYYMVKPSTEAAPSALEMIADGIAGEETTISISELSANTSYTCYVLPTSGDKNGAIASVSGSTADFEDKYEAYNAGHIIKVADKSYSKDINGEAKLVVASKENEDLLSTEAFAGAITAGGVLFLETPTGTSFSVNASSNSTVKEILLISKTKEKVKVNMDANGKINLKAGFTISGLEITYASRVWGLSDSISHLYAEDCTFNVPHNQPFIYGTNRYIESMRFLKCKFFNNTTSGNQEQLFNFGASPVLRSMKEVRFEDNIFHSAAPIKFTIINFAPTPQTAGTVGGEKVIMKNNIFYNCVGLNRYFNLWHADRVEIDKNVYYCDTHSLGNASCVAMYCTEEGAAVTEFVLGDNITFGGKAVYTGIASLVQPTGNNWWKEISSTPFAGKPAEKDFSLISEYEGYGPRN